jgi:long-chain acyl-CoA synthetase
MSGQADLDASASKLKARNMVELFNKRVAESGPKLACRARKDGKWTSLTWNELNVRTNNLAYALIERGLKVGDRVAVFARTRLEWQLADMAIIAAGGVTVPIYDSNTADETVYIIENSGARFGFVDNDAKEKAPAGRLSRFLEVKSKVPALEALIVMEDAAARDGAEKMSDWEAKGAEYGKSHPDDLKAIAEAIKQDDPACFIYTSGTTGKPKGVVLMHRSFIFEGEALGQMELMKPEDTLLLFLPLAHVFGKTATAAWISLGFQLDFCDNIDKLMEYLAESKPTVLPAVPRIFEKVYSAVIQKTLATPGVKGKLAKYSLGEFDKYAAAKIEGKQYSSLGLSIGKRLVFSKIAETLKERLGGRMRLCISGSAPLAPKIAHFFDFCGVLILEGYGLSENTAGTTINRIEKNKIGTVGAIFPGAQMRLAEDGEIELRGLHVMKGYWQNQEETDKSLTPDGWLKTGDIGNIDADGYLKITDRKKDLFKTSGGKYIAPQYLENQIKTSPIISQVMIHGASRKFVSALVTVNEDVAKKVLTDAGQTPGSYVEMIKRPEVNAEVKKVFDALNATLPSYETIKKFAILDVDLTVESGDLTPTLKVKRKVVETKYAKILDAFYAEGVGGGGGD